MRLWFTELLWTAFTPEQVVSAIHTNRRLHGKVGPTSFEVGAMTAGGLGMWPSMRGRMRGGEQGTLVEVSYHATRALGLAGLALIPATFLLLLLASPTKDMRFNVIFSLSAPVALWFTSLRTTHQARGILREAIREMAEGREALLHAERHLGAAADPLESGAAAQAPVRLRAVPGMHHVSFAIGQGGEQIDLRVGQDGLRFTGALERTLPWADLRAIDLTDEPSPRLAMTCADGQVVFLDFPIAPEVPVPDRRWLADYLSARAADRGARPEDRAAAQHLGQVLAARHKEP